MEGRIILRTFYYRHEAEFFKSLLEANGIESFIVSDDCGSWDPALGFARGVHLMINSDLLQQAEEIISSEGAN
jgi:hypothetical protein